MSLTAYVRYDNKGRIVPGGPIVTSVKPKVGDWVAISDVLVTTTPPNYKLRAFVRYINRIGGQNNSNKYVAGSLILQHDAPQDGNWKEVYFIKPCDSCNTTTTTTTTTCVPFINTIIISNGSYADANGTYTRNSPSEVFTLIGGTGVIFFGGDAWYIFNTAIGNVARNTSELGTGSWVPWEPGNSTGIIAEYIYQQCTTTTSTTSSSTTSTTSTTTTVAPTTTTTTSIFLYYYDVEIYASCGGGLLLTTAVFSTVPAVIDKWYTKTDENLPFKVIGTTSAGAYSNYTTYFQQTPRDTCEI